MPSFVRKESDTRPKRITDCDPQACSCGDNDRTDMTDGSSSCAFIGDIPYYSSCSFESKVRTDSTLTPSHDGISTRAMSLTTLYGCGSFADFVNGVSLPR